MTYLKTIYDLKGTAEIDLAYEEQLLCEGYPALFLYSWQNPVLVLGYGQNIGTVDSDYCRENNIPVLRRISGGTGVFHLRDLAVTLTLPLTHPWAAQIAEGYSLFTGALSRALSGLVEGLTTAPPAAAGMRSRSPICFEDYFGETLLHGGKKVVGCAQARRSNAVLIHGSILLNRNLSLYAKVFGVPAEKIEEIMAPLPLHPDELPSIAEKITAAFSTALQLPFSVEPLPALPQELKERYTMTKWAPVN